MCLAQSVLAFERNDLAVQANRGGVPPAVSGGPPPTKIAFAWGIKVSYRVVYQCLDLRYFRGMVGRIFVQRMKGRIFNEAMKGVESALRFWVAVCRIK